MLLKVFFSYFFGFFLVYFFFLIPLAQADTLRIKNTGEIVILNNAQAIIESYNFTPQAIFQIPKRSVLSATTGVVSVTVQVSPFLTTKGTPALKSTISNGKTSIDKNVNQVVQQAADGEPDIYLQSNGNNQIVITQNTTEVVTSLPVLLDAKNHILYVMIHGSQIEVAVQPNDITSTLLQQGLLINPSSEKISLIEKNNQPVYVIDGEEKARILKLFTLTSAINVELSANDKTLFNKRESHSFAMLRSLNTNLSKVFHSPMFVPVP